jgi:hypothetical protein
MMLGIMNIKFIVAINIDRESNLTGERIDTIRTRENDIAKPRR